MSPRRLRVQSCGRITLCLLTLIAAGGCESTPKTPAASGEAMQAYQARQYERAFELASAQVRHSSGARHDRAQFIAGMSTYHLGNETSAMRHLAPLASNSSPDIAGPANATLGLIHAKRRQYERALGHFRKAVKHLHGDDLANAYFHLGATEQKLGRWSSARTHMSMAISNSHDPDFRRAVRQRMNAEAFTLQFGAYSSRANAAERARALGTELRAAGIGTPSIASTSAGGKTLYLVQAGEYASYDSALSARRRLKRTDVIITRRSE